MTTQEDIQEGLRKAFSGTRKGDSLFKPKPIGKYQERKPQKSFFEPPKREQEVEEVEEEPFWNGEDWEEWAVKIYQNYPKMRDYLPEWFIIAVENAD